MAKSNMRAARMRRTNRHIQVIERRQRQMRYAEYAQHRHSTSSSKFINSWLDQAKSIFRWFGDFLGGLFSRATPGIASLNLTSDRGAGAVWLRQTFNQNLRMRSTRDGKPV